MPSWRADRRTLCSALIHLLHGSRASVFRSKPCTPTPTALFLKPRKKNEVSVVLICNENLENTSKLLSFKLEFEMFTLEGAHIQSPVKGMQHLIEFYYSKIFFKKRCQLKEQPHKHTRVQLLC